ncbi:MAG: 1-acyl-sn-glycerol-3-phosphate acyltransferase [Saprospiraceae bacterium]|nr:1-acyl-sn-glycerol-3-phosphate acyltransferase [Saprospiraceae bacterium]
MNQKPFIDVRKILEDKNKAAAKVLPNFVINYLKRIVHEDEINAFIEKNGHLRNHDFVHACFEEMGAKVTFTGLENVPTTGGCIIAANHPLGGLDAIGLMKIVGQRRPDIRFFVNDILLNLQGFGELFVGVNKHGKNPKENLRLMDEVFASDMCVLFFPAGLVSRRKNGVIRDLAWQKSFITKAIRYDKPIIPTFIGGQNSSFFYSLANFRKKVGIKTNIEMLYLADEMYKQRNQTINYVFGDPLSKNHFTKDKNHWEWAQEVREYVYGLAEDSEVRFE